MVEQLQRYRELFGDRGYLLAELHRGPDDQRRLEQRLAWSRRTGLPLVAAGDVHYHTAARLILQDVLTAIRLGTTVAEVGAYRFPNAQRHLRPPEEIAALFARHRAALTRTREIVERCTFSLGELRYEYPPELAPPAAHPWSICATWPCGVPTAAILKECPTKSASCWTTS